MQSLVWVAKEQKKYGCRWSEFEKKSYALENECLLMKENVLMASVELLANDFCIMPE